MKRRSARSCCCAAVAAVWLACAGGVHAQLAPDRPALSQPSGALPPRFQKVEQTIADVDPLRVSIRHFPTDLRHPTGFQDVFRIAGSGSDSSRLGIPNPTGADLFARVHGAVTAVFPQSVYIQSGGGTVALIPPGTIFFIGELPFDRFARTEEQPAPPTKVNLRVDSRVEASTGGPARVAPATPERPAPKAASKDDAGQKAEEAKPPPASLMTDETVRRSAVRELLMRAVDSTREPESSEGPRAPEKKETAAAAASERR